LKKETLTDVIVVGGGLAGLCASIHLSQSGVSVILIEKNSYPKHKVCGEYVSNEVLPYLKFLGLDPFKHGAKRISEFELTTRRNKKIYARLPLGGFGISRYTLDYELYKLALASGVNIIKDQVLDINFQQDQFFVETKQQGKFQSKVAVGAFGKRSNLDMQLQRDFIKRKSPYLGVKIHVSGEFPENKVALHNFKGGYCGVSKVENNHINLCYITSFKAFKTYRNIESFQEQVLFKNKALKAIFKETKPEFDQALSISQISFETKNPVEQHLLMCGDSAGMIHPLCGNGMGMAIRSAQLVSEAIIDYLQGQLATREALEETYRRQWKSNFTLRLKAGHTIAYMFRQDRLAAGLLNVLRAFPFLIPWIIRMTHGKPMNV